jgi:hypothetical protein
MESHEKQNIYLVNLWNNLLFHMVPTPQQLGMSIKKEVKRLTS